MRWLPLVLLLGFAQPTQAQYLGIVPASFEGSGVLTKLGENNYEFWFQLALDDYYLPPGGIDPTTGYPVSYTPYFAGWQYGISSIVPGVYDWSEGFGRTDWGFIRSTGAPVGVMNIWASQDIEGQFQDRQRQQSLHRGRTPGARHHAGRHPD